MRGVTGAELSENWVRLSQPPQEHEFRDKVFIGDLIMLAFMPEDLYSPRVCGETRSFKLVFETLRLEYGRIS